MLNESNVHNIWEIVFFVCYGATWFYMISFGFICGLVCSFQAVFHVEYVDNHSQGQSKAASVCHDHRRPAGFTTEIKDWDLYAWRIDCHDTLVG